MLKRARATRPTNDRRLKTHSTDTRERLRTLLRAPPSHRASAMRVAAAFDASAPPASSAGRLRSDRRPSRATHRPLVARESASVDVPPARRAVLLSLLTASGALAAPSRALVDAGDWSSPGLRSEGPPAEYRRTPSGLVYEEVNEGTGDAAEAGDVAVFEYVARRANGYFIYATIDCGIGCGNGDPVEFELGPRGRLIPGLDELLTGMKPGGKRRALIKPEIAYGGEYRAYEPQPPEYGQRRQIERLTASNEPIIFEVKLVKTRRRR